MLVPDDERFCFCRAKYFASVNPLLLLLGLTQQKVCRLIYSNPFLVRQIMPRQAPLTYIITFWNCELQQLTKLVSIRREGKIKNCKIFKLAKKIAAKNFSEKNFSRLVPFILKADC